MKNIFDLKNIRGDLFGGITAGIVALPLALAFGVQSGMGAIAGLYGAMVLGMVAAVFGGTATQVSGPTGPMTVISAMLIATAIEMTGSLQAAILLGLGKFAAYIPMSVLAGILITVGFGIMDYKGLGHIQKVPRADAAILIIVLLITVFGNLLHAVGVGILLACVLFMKKSSDLAESSTSVTALEGFDGEQPWDDEGSVYKEYKGKIYIKHLYGAMFFGFTSRFQELIKELDDGIRVLIIRMDKVPHIDQSGIYAMEEAITDLQKKGVIVALSGVQPQPLDMLKNIDIIPALIPEKYMFMTFQDCELWLKRKLRKENGGFDNMHKI